MKNTILHYAGLVSAITVALVFLSSCNSNTPDSSMISPESRTACTQKPSAGPCRAALTRYYYDETLNQCKSFIWGGCKGQVPFKSLKSCKRSCETIQDR